MQPLPADQPNFGSDPWKLVHPGANWILGVDWVRARNSPAGRILARQFQGAESRLETSGLGLQAVTSVDRIIASGVGLEMKDSADSQGLVVAIEGSIDRAKLKKSMPPGTAMERLRGADLYVPPGSKPGEPLIAVHGTRWMLIGDRPSLALILEGKGGARDASLYGRAARLAMEAEIWLAVADTARALGTVPVRGPLDSLRAMDLLVSLQRGLRLQAALTADSAESARMLAGMFRVAAPASGQDAGAWLKRIQVGMKGNQVIAALDIPAAELEAGMEQARAAALELGKRALESALSGGALSPQNAASPASAANPSPPSVATNRNQAPPAPRVHTIRIVGLEEGMREIQYTAPSGGLL
ncbi:MAG: hypothetical protein N2036_03920 [Bryobacteraceae bacterium]|nr:hypothetical protein [Bryobacteraceae bacterium]